MIRRLALAVSLAFSGTSVGAAPSLQTPHPGRAIDCHVLYGGDDEVVTVRPTTSPYEEPLRKRGGFFRFRAVYEVASSVGDTLKFYTYSRQDDRVVLVHQATFAVPARRLTARHGFTGLHAVYEPRTEAELQYWCELQAPHEPSKSPAT